MRGLKITVRVFLFIILLLAIALAGVSFYFYQVAIARGSKDFLQGESSEESGTASAYTEDQEWLEQQNVENVDMISEDGLKLRGYYIAAPKRTNRIAILAHGYSGKGKDMVGYARFYRDTLGYHVLMPDDRGHGESDGTYIGFGWKDRKDYQKWIDLMIRRIGNDSQIVLHGVSMGGATVLMTAGEELPGQVKAVVSDCAYTSVEAQLGHQLEQMYELPKFPLLYTTSIVSKVRAGYSFKEASALEQVKKTLIPTLFIHGDADEFVPYEMVQELYDACLSDKELYVVKGAGHGTAYREDPEGYERAVSSFLGRYITEEE